MGTAVDGTSEVVSLRHDVTAERKPPRNAPGKGNGREEMAAAEHWRGTAGRVSVNRRDATVAFGQGRGPRGGRGEAAGASGGQSRCFSETISLVPPQITGQRPLQGRRTAPAHEPRQAVTRDCKPDSHAPLTPGSELVRLDGLEFYLGHGAWLLLAVPQRSRA